MRREINRAVHFYLAEKKITAADVKEQEPEQQQFVQYNNESAPKAWLQHYC